MTENRPRIDSEDTGGLALPATPTPTRSALTARQRDARGTNAGEPPSSGRRPCDSSCRKPTPSMAHCASCHRTWGGVYGFDQHRKAGECLDPQTLGWVERDGVWREPMSPAAREWFGGRP